mmetsp:Transcript_2467/g.6976  ORF Transcript_2467/g.6976 Transcript_2467/m.6976 type:complete len:241 (-) Transcript_2467:114-836(-)
MRLSEGPRRASGLAARTSLCGLLALSVALVSHSCWNWPCFVGSSVSRGAGTHGHVRGVKRRSISGPGEFLPLDALEPAVTAFIDALAPFTQVYKESTPEFLLRWGHAFGGFLLFAVYGGYGAFLGWQVRTGGGDKVFPWSYDQPARARHKEIMSTLLFVAFFEVGDGLIALSAFGDQRALRSAHSSTAVLVVILMVSLAAISTTMGQSKLGRAAHTYLGAAALLVWAVHLYYGLALGWSI